MISELTDRQRQEMQHFDNTKTLQKVDLNHYSKPEFGPWNPYWHVYNYLRAQYTGPEQRLLSFGCGRGANALRYAAIGYDVYGFDISPHSVDNAISLASKYGLAARTHFSVQRAESLNYPDGFFDHVVGENILHHVDVAQASAEVARVLRPGGTAVFKEPLASPRRDRLRRSAPVRLLIPIGVKNLRHQSRYTHPPDTAKLEPATIAILRDRFAHVEVVQFRVLAVLNLFARKRTFLERCDLALFHRFPSLRRLGDMAVIIVRNHGSVLNG